MEWPANNVKSYGQIFLLQRSLYVRFYPIDSPRYTRHVYTDFINEVGAPTTMCSDGAQAENKCKKTQRILRTYVVPWIQTMAANKHQNKAERFVQELQKQATKMQDRCNSDPKYAKFLYIHCCHMYNKTVYKSLGYRTPEENFLGVIPDISHLRFSWWDQVWYYETGQKIPNSRMLPGRWLGIDTMTEDSITFHILTMPKDGTRSSVISRHLVTPRQPSERAHGELPRLRSDYYFPDSITRVHLDPIDEEDDEAKDEDEGPELRLRGEMGSSKRPRTNSDTTVSTSDLKPSSEEPRHIRTNYRVEEDTIKYSTRLKSIMRRRIHNKDRQLARETYHANINRKSKN